MSEVGALVMSVVAFYGGYLYAKLRIKNQLLQAARRRIFGYAGKNK